MGTPAHNLLPLAHGHAPIHKSGVCTHAHTNAHTHTLTSVYTHTPAEEKIKGKE